MTETDEGKDYISCTKLKNLVQIKAHYYFYCPHLDKEQLGWDSNKCNRKKLRKKRKIK